MFFCLWWRKKRCCLRILAVKKPKKLLNLHKKKEDSVVEPQFSPRFKVHKDGDRQKSYCFLSHTFYASSNFEPELKKSSVVLQLVVKKQNKTKTTKKK